MTYGSVCEVTYGSEAALSSTGLKDGYSPGVYFGSGFVALLAVVGDVRMIVRGGIFGAQRIARHVWRMCIALFVASGSFFLGQQQVFPAAVRNTHTSYPHFPANCTHDFLVAARWPYKGIQRKVDAARR